MFTGSLVALITPLTEHDQLDLDALRKVLQYHLDNQTNGLVIAGTTGESATLSTKEKELLIKTTLEYVAGRIPVIVGTGAQGTEQTIWQTKQAMALGVDGVLVMTPAYIKPPQRGLVKHYQTIASHCDTPIILYNVPGRTACDMSAETTIQLSKVDNIVGTKEASGDVDRVATIAEQTASDFTILSGEDSQTLDFIQRGGHGVISVTANVAPALMSQLCQYAHQQQWQNATTIANQLTDLNTLLFIESNPIPCKWAMSQLNLCEPSCRSPLCTLDSKHHQALLDCLATLELLNK